MQQQAKLPPGGLDWSQLAVPLLPPVCWTDLARSVHKEILVLAVQDSSIGDLVTHSLIA